MAKDPAFLFYSDNFQSGTQFFTDEQTGKYIRLLCAQHLHGHLSEKHMIHICKTHDVEIWAKFAKDEHGKYYNERLENEVFRRRNYSESRSKNRKSTTKKQKKPKNISSTYVNHMGNENGIGNGNELWDSIKQNFFNDFRWKEKFCRDKGVTMLDLELRMNEFISDTELKEDYKELPELKNHFTNLFNKNKNGKQLGTSGERISATKNF